MWQFRRYTLTIWIVRFRHNDLDIIVAWDLFKVAGELFFCLDGLDLRSLLCGQFQFFDQSVDVLFAQRTDGFTLCILLQMDFYKRDK